MSKDDNSRFRLEEFHRNVSDSDLVADLIRVSRELGKKSVTFREYNSLGKFSSSTVAARFGSWFGALAKAGLEKTVERNIPSEALFKNIVEVWTLLGRQPKTRDLATEISKYSASTYAERFGGWRNALEQFVVWANDLNIPIDQNDLLDLKSHKTPRNINWRLRAKVLMRDGAKCRLCGASPSDGAKLHVDHIHPWSKGGETEILNLQILCEPCNIGKSDFITE